MFLPTSCLAQGRHKQIVCVEGGGEGVVVVVVGVVEWWGEDNAGLLLLLLLLSMVCRSARCARRRCSVRVLRPKMVPFAGASRLT